MSRTLPPLAIVLGLGGLVPFLACGAGAVLLAGADASRCLGALIAYAAVILSFLGAVHWGFALDGTRTAPVGRLAGGVLPALVGWGALVVAELLAVPDGALALLAAAFALVLAAERRGARAGFVPRAYLGLRWTLTVVVVPVLLAVMVLRLAHVSLVAHR